VIRSIWIVPGSATDTTAATNELRRLMALGRRPAGPPSSESLGQLAMASAAAMDAELGAWFAAYRVKDLSLP
jgi:hypothetical protein